MLIHFTFANFRSFRDEKTLSLEASSTKEHTEAVLETSNGKLLPVVALYGANSSGKSNVLKALSWMRNMVIDSVRLNPQDTLGFSPFQLDNNSSERPTSFEIEFIAQGERYRYGYEYNHTQIISEWLYQRLKGKREVALFLRAEEEFKISTRYFKEGIGKEPATQPNRLFVSLCAQLRGAISTTLLDWFGNCNLISGLSSDGYGAFTTRMFGENLRGYRQAKDFFHHTQLGFSDLVLKNKATEQSFLLQISQALQEGAPDSTRDKSSNVEFRTRHTIYDADGNALGEKLFDRNEMESEGSKKIIDLSGPLFDTLNRGGVLLIDELDAKLHPFLTRSIIRLFMNKETNPGGAQLIFTTHDTNLLDLELLRRDQIWFTEKDRTDASDLYSLVEFKHHRVSKPDRDYLNGRYGAIPFINYAALMSYDEDQATGAEKPEK